jgi:hypothetical protein
MNLLARAVFLIRPRRAQQWQFTALEVIPELRIKAEYQDVLFRAGVLCTRMAAHLGAYN